MAETSPARSTDMTLRTAILSAVFSSAATALYVLAGTEPAPVVALFIAWSPTFCVILWLQKDAARTNVGSVLDLGYFLCLAWPVVLPWYVLKTRGRSGWRLFLGLLAVMFAPHVTALLVAAAEHAVELALN